MGQLTEKRGTTQKIVAAWLQIGKKKKICMIKLFSIFVGHLSSRLFLQFTKTYLHLKERKKKEQSNKSLLSRLKELIC